MFVSKTNYFHTYSSPTHPPLSDSTRSRLGGTPWEGLKRISDGVVRLCARGIEHGLSEDDEFWCQDGLGAWGEPAGKWTDRSRGFLFKFLPPSLSHLQDACLDVDELRNRRVEYLEFADEFMWLLEEEDTDMVAFWIYWICIYTETETCRPRFYIFHYQTIKSPKRNIVAPTNIYNFCFRHTLKFCL